jgi:heme O synthase-like polyprenyltransferase
MLPVVAGRAAAARQILIYAACLFSLRTALGARVCRHDLWRDRLHLRRAFSLARSSADPECWVDRRAAHRLFSSISYLFLLFAALLVDHNGGCSHDAFVA